MTAATRVADVVLTGGQGPLSNRRWLRDVGSVVAVFGIAACLTLLWLGMRSVMGVGGTCASGGPYDIAVQCPKGVDWIMPVSIIWGVAFVGLFRLCARPAAQKAVVLAWTALFVSLGWNFLQAGFPQGEGGWQVEGLLLGGMFVVMGVVPLVPAAPKLIQAVRYGEADPSRSQVPAGRDGPDDRWRRQLSNNLSYLPPSSPFDVPPATPARFTDPDFVEALDRLAQLHKNNDLTDAEYHDAVRKLIGQGG
ncbi:MAG: hypothetical protein WCP28_04160 [Actinomycetes bacterium]